MNAKPPRILVTGAGGQLGYELACELAPLGEVVATTRDELDLAKPDSIVAAVRSIDPSIIVNAAAYTAVDRAESEPDIAHAVNARAPGIFAESARQRGAILVHFSTDYVFDGRQAGAYDEMAQTHPLGVYGNSKLEGERAIAQSGAMALVFRSSWIYAARGNNFLLTMRRLARERDELRVVDDQHGTPNWSRTLARATARVIGDGNDALRKCSGLYHMSSTGATTWHGFACAIVDATAEGSMHPVAKPRVVAISTAQYPTPAARPANSVLDCGLFERTFGFALPPWRQALAECLSGIDR